MKTLLLFLLVTFSAASFSAEVCTVSVYQASKDPKSVSCTESSLKSQRVRNVADFLKQLLESGYVIDSTVPATGGYIHYTLIKKD